MTPLASLLRERIRAGGPMSVAEFMAAALGHPQHGYYVRRDPLGAAGDFITAPEISQMFGELVGLWCAVMWQQMGAPSRLRLVELGPGRGTLMGDALRAGAMVPGFREALDIHLVETSPALRERQREALGSVPAAWHNRVEEVPAGPILVVANEFFDALPIRQYQRAQGRWHERLVDMDGDKRFRFVLGPAVEPELAPAHAEAPNGAVVETCPAGTAIARHLGERVARDGGAVLAIDYGPAKSAHGDSLQAVRKHAYANVLDDPGESDLTAHVDFQALAAAATAARAFGPIPQGLWLRRLGIEARTNTLSRNHPDAAEDLAAACRRLIHPQEMGTLFKVLALTHPGSAPPPGFDAAGSDKG